MVAAWHRPLAMWAVCLVVLGIGATFIEDEPPSNVRLDITGAEDTIAPEPPATGAPVPAESAPAVETQPTGESAPTTVATVAPAGLRATPAVPADEPDLSWVLTGRITDAAANPVAGICITAMQGGTLDTTGADGRYRVEMDSGVNPPWMLRDCSSDPFGWIEQFVAARYEPGETTEYDIVMTRLSGVRGRVIDVNGDPVAGVCPGAPVADHRVPPAPVATGPDGQFRIGGVIPGIGGMGVGACPQQALYASPETFTFTPGQWTEVTLVVTLPGQVPPGGVPAP